jgi:hypothetical protein
MYPQKSTVLAFLTKSDSACCTTAELLKLKRDNPEDVNILKQWAAEEMQARGIEIEEK